MTRPLRPTRDRLAEIPAGTELLREIRFRTDAELAELSPLELTNAARWLRAAAYSANEGARRLDTHLRTRTTTEQDSEPCSPCPPSATTPPDPEPDPGSPSISTTTPDEPSS